MSIFNRLIKNNLPTSIKFIPNRKCPSVEKLLYNFWIKVDIKNKNDYWPWLGALSGKNTRNNCRVRGSFSIQGKNYVSSRLSYILCIGDPGEYMVCHTCDNGLCCNPNHFFLGTNDDNQKDMHNKNRHIALKGLESPRAKLTRKQITKICKLHKKGVKATELAIKFGVGKSTIHYLLSGTTYKNVERPL